jgi:hypothetical protein
LTRPGCFRTMHVRSASSPTSSSPYERTQPESVFPLGQGRAGMALSGWKRRHLDPNSGRAGLE